MVSQLLRIYRKHLARHYGIRLLKSAAMLVYRGAYSFVALVVHAPHSGTYSFCALSDSDCGTAKRITSLAAGETVAIPPPIFLGHSSEAAARKNPRIEIETPPLEVFELTRTVAVGGIDFLFMDETAIHHDLFNPLLHRCPAENLGVVSINRQHRDLNLRLTKSCRQVPAAAVMIGQCSHNYAHWLTETLPKLSILDAVPECAGLPVIVDADLHPNIYASLNLLNRSGREIIKVERWQPVLVDRLVAVSQPAYERYAPHDIFSREAPPHVNTFSRAALERLREAAHKAIQHQPAPDRKVVFLARSDESSNIRHIENMAEVQQLIQARGIDLVEPESMTFAEQVAVCSGAEVIIAPVGASLANMIFAAPGCKIVVLSPYYDDANFFYYTNLAGVLGHELYYVLGTQTNTGQHPLHRNYTIDTSTLETALRWAHC